MTSGFPLSPVTPPHPETLEGAESVAAIGLSLRSKTQDRLDLLLRRDDISCVRRVSVGILRNRWFDIGISSVILFNIVVMIIDANFQGECALSGVKACELEEHAWTGLAEFVFLGCYMFELVLRLIAEGRGFFRSSWNNADFFVVLAGIVEVALAIVLDRDLLSVLQILKIFRVTRILRAIRLLRFFPHLFAMVQGFVHALAAMGWGLVMLLILLVMISVIAVEMIAPNNVEHDIDWCTEAFGSVWTATIFFFQITVAGDSWGACAIPLMREHFYTSFVFIGAVCLVELGFMNLILSAIIQTAQEAQENDMQEKKQHILHQKQQSAVELRSIFRQIDRDGNGTLTYDELLAAYDDKHGKANGILTVLDVSRNDLPELFQLMDMDGSDAVGHKEFVECIRKAQVQDMRIQMLTMKLQLDRISRSIGKEVKKAVRHCLLEKGVITKGLPENDDSSEDSTASKESTSWSERNSSDPPPKGEKLLCEPDEEELTSWTERNSSDPPPKDEKLRREPDEDIFVEPPPKHNCDGKPELGRGGAVCVEVRKVPPRAEELPLRRDVVVVHDAGPAPTRPGAGGGAQGEEPPPRPGPGRPAAAVPNPRLLLPPKVLGTEPRRQQPPQTARRSEERPPPRALPGRSMAVSLDTRAANPAAPVQGLPKGASAWQRGLQESASSAPQRAVLKEHFLQLHEFKKAALRIDSAHHLAP